MIGKISPEPKFLNGCQHPPDTFVCSFQYFHSAGKDDWYDLYIFSGVIDKDEQVCIRYGDKDYKYVSPGTILDVAKSANPLYKRVVEVIQSCGKVTFQKNKEGSAENG